MPSSSFLRSHWPLLLYGWILSFASGFGQTYFISLFGGAIRADFGLEHGAYGLSYSFGTLVSGFLLLWFGRLIDRVSLRAYSLAAVLGLAVATLAMSFAQGLWALTLVFFLLRFFGQGLMSHAAITSMGRYFSAERGRAVAFSVTGHVAGGALFPLLAAALTSGGHWRHAWLFGSLALAFLIAPSVIYLLSPRRFSHGSRHGSHAPAGASVAGANGAPAAREQSPGAPARDWTSSEALRDPRMYAYLAVLLAPSFVTTGIIFHQVHIGAQKGWGLDIIAVALSIYAVASFVTTLGGGYLIDRFSARRLVSTSLGPMIVACLVMTQVTSPAGAIGFFILLGLGSGLTTVLMGAVWAEAYGTRHLGAIRAIAASGSVFASAAAPGIFGLLLDGGWTIGWIATMCALYCAAASVAAMIVTRS